MTAQSKRGAVMEGYRAQDEDPLGCVCPQDYVEPNCPAHDPEGTYYPSESEDDRLRRQLAGAVDALRKIDALLEADINRGAFMVRLEQITADALSLYGGR